MESEVGQQCPHPLGAEAVHFDTLGGEEPRAIKERDTPERLHLGCLDVVAPEAAKVADVELAIGDNRVGPRLGLPALGLAGR